MTRHGSRQIKGIAYAILSSSTFGFAPFFTLLLIGYGLSTFEVLTYRWGVAALALGIMGILAGHNFRIGWRDFGAIALLGIFRALTSLCLVIAYQNIATGVASAIHFLYPLATAAGMALFFHEKLSWKTTLAILASLAGAALLSANDFSSGSSDAMTGIVTACLRSGDPSPFDTCMDIMGRAVVREALRQCRGNRSQAARLLGLSRPTLLARMEKYGLKIETRISDE